MIPWTERQSIAERLISGLGARALFEALTPAERVAFLYSYLAWVRPSRRLSAEEALGQGLSEPGWGCWSGQEEPPGEWLNWILCAGRGYGKSWRITWFILTRALRFPSCRIALVAQTTTSLWRDCIFGKAGLVAQAPPWFAPRLHKNGKSASFPNKSSLHLFTAEVPKNLKGPNNDFGAVEEMCAQPYAREAWDQLQMTMRSGVLPQTIVATTPQPPIPLLVELVQSKSSAVTIGDTRDNRGNNSRVWMEQKVLPLLGTQFGAEEVEGKIILQAQGALFRKEWFDRKWVWKDGEVKPSKFRCIGMGVDPAETSGPKADSWGIVVGGLREDGLIEILEDATTNAPPEVATKLAVERYKVWGATFMIADVGRSGKMVKGMVKLVDKNVNVLEKGGNLGKEGWARPAALLYSQKRVFHSHPMPILESQCCRWTNDVKAWSPDAMDAMAYVVTELEKNATIGGDTEVYRTPSARR